LQPVAYSVFIESWSNFVLKPVSEPNIMIIKQFISIEERRILATWGTQMLPFLKRNERGAQRAYNQIQFLPWIPPEYTSVRRRLQERLGVSDEDKENDFGWFLGSIGDGGFIHEHQDKAPHGCRHLRCNLYVQLPDSGGEPVIEGVLQPFEEGTLLCFFPNEQRHGARRVYGPQRRITCSFGYVVPKCYRLVPENLIQQC
jgi:hypothetical protein